MNVESIVSYPVKDDGSTQMLIGGVLTLLSVLLLPFFLVFGYYYEVMHDTIKGKTNPPKFTTDNIIRLSVKGAGVLGVTLVYGVIWTIVTSIAWVLLSPDVFQAPQQIDTTPEPLALIGVLIISTIIAGVLGYLANASFISYAANDSIVSAFSPGNIITIITSGRYLVMNFLLIVIGVIAIVMLLIFSAIPIVGIVTPFVQFPFFVVVWHALGTVGHELNEDLTTPSG
jgi:hypothetical protein